ncbi:MAG: low temperature requirement protein A [Thermomicrobiales bacterium]
MAAFSSTERTEIEPERHASWLELFFDLCFVVAVGAVAHTLHDHPTADGAVLFAALFIPVWWSWMMYAWYATSFPERGAIIRFGAFAAMLTVLAMAAQVGRASAGDPRGYLLAFVVFHAIVVILYLRAAGIYAERRVFAIRYATGFALAAAVWFVSLAVPAEMRSWVWAVALGIDLLTPWFAVVSVPERTFDVSHIPERYGLFSIIVLGEAIIAVARGTADSEWTMQAAVAAVAGFVIAVVIWWAYFARPPTSLLLRGRIPAFVWGNGHLFVWAGIAVTGVGIELAIEAAESSHGFPITERLILCGGFALYLAALALLRAAEAGSFTDRIALMRLATAAVIVALGISGAALSPEILTLVMAAITVGAGSLIRFAWRSQPAPAA